MLNNVRYPLLPLADNFRRGHARFHQSAEEQVPLEEVLCQASPAGLPARADGLRGRQHGNVSVEILLRLKYCRIYIVFAAQMKFQNNGKTNVIWLPVES